MVIHLPDLSTFRLHRTVEDIDWDGVPVPRLRGTFYRRPEGDRTVSVGVYHHAGRPVFVAWGYVGEEHCRYTVVRRADGGWDLPRPGCPPVRVVRDPGWGVSGLAIDTADGQTWTSTHPGPADHGHPEGRISGAAPVVQGECVSPPGSDGPREDPVTAVAVPRPSAAGRPS